MTYYNHYAPDYSPFGLFGFAVASLIAMVILLRMAHRKPNMTTSQRVFALLVGFWSACLGSIVIGWATYIAYYGVSVLK